MIINRQLLWTLDDDHLLLLLFAFAHFWINNVFLLIFFFVLGCFVLCVGLSLVRRVQLLLNILLLWALFCFLLHKTIPHWLLNLEIMLFVVNFISKFNFSQFLSQVVLTQTFFWRRKKCPTFLLVALELLSSIVKPKLCLFLLCRKN